MKLTTRIFLLGFKYMPPVVIRTWKKVHDLDSTKTPWEVFRSGIFGKYHQWFMGVDSFYPYDKVLALIREFPGLSHDDISRLLGISERFVHRYTDRLEWGGFIERRFEEGEYHCLISKDGRNNLPEYIPKPPRLALTPPRQRTKGAYLTGNMIVPPVDFFCFALILFPAVMAPIAFVCVTLFPGPNSVLGSVEFVLVVSLLVTIYLVLLLWKKEKRKFEERKADLRKMRQGESES